jgi:hypothetical protein
MSEMEEYLAMLKKHPPFEEGKTVYDVPYVARKWKEAGFSVEEAEEWVKVGAYMEHHATGMKALGLTPKDVDHQVEFTGSFALWFARGFIHEKNYQRFLKQPKPEFPRMKVAVVEREF